MTATQLGDIYLTVVPLQNTSAVQQSDAHRHNEGTGEGLMVAGMSFALFCRAILYMALLAYRNLDPAVPTTYKVGLTATGYQHSLDFVHTVVGDP